MAALIDLHVHSHASPCSCLDAATIAREALARGGIAVAVVDHERFPPADLVAQVRARGVVCLAGAEVATADGDLLVFGVTDLPPPGDSGPATSQRVLEAGGAVVVAHPFRRGRPASPALLCQADVGTEVLNGRCTATENGRARAWALFGNRSTTGGSDAHAPGELGTLLTRLPHLPRHERDLASMLRCGAARAWVPAPSPPGDGVPRTALLPVPA